MENESEHINAKLTSFVTIKPVSSVANIVVTLPMKLAIPKTVPE